MWISFVFEKELIYILFYIPPFFIRSFLDNKILKDNNSINGIIDKLAKICLIIFYIIEKIKLQSTDKKRRNNELEISNNPLIKYKKQIQKRNSCLSISLLIFSIIFDLISLKSGNYFIIDISKYSEIGIFLFVDIIFFTKKFFSHHIISVIIIIIIFFIELIFNFYQNKNILLQLTAIILYNYSYSFSRLLLKYINTKYYISIYLMGSLIGISQFIYLIIFTKDIIFGDKYFSFIIYFISCLILHFIYFKVLSELNPIHTLLCYKIPEFFYSLINTDTLYYSILINIICLISCLIYLEILQLNFCGLNKNLKTNIYKRGIVDFQNINLSFINPNDKSCISIE